MESDVDRSLDNSPEYILIIDNITKKYGKFVAVDQVSLKVERGEFLTLLGPSGSGKSTILMMIAGFQNPTSGKILLTGENILFKPSYKRNIGVAFQNYALFPHMTVFDNIAFPLRMRKMSKQDIKENVETVLEQVELTEFRRRYPKQLSGGQQQRVAVARAIAAEPRIVLADEPTANLDSKTAASLLDLMRQLNRQEGTTFLFSTHDPLVMQRATRTVRLRDGEIAEDTAGSASSEASGKKEGG